MSEFKKWHVIYTCPGCEKKVAELLLKQNIESYSPVKYTAKSTYWKSEFVEAPLFPCEVFARLCETQYAQVLKMHGVSNILYWLEKPAIITNEEINLIRKYTEGYRSLDIEKICADPNADAVVLDNSFLQRDDNVIELHNTCTRVHLPSLGYAIIVVARNNVQLVSATAKRRFFWQLDRKQAS